MPFSLILIAGVEMMNYPTYSIRLLDGILVFARLIHVHGFATKQSVGAGRPVGTMSTLSILVISSVMILLKFLV